MGASMAGHLLDARRGRGRLQPHAREGRAAARARARAGPTRRVTRPRRREVTISMVGLPADVEDVYLAPGGVIERARPGSVLIDMSTSSPALARRIAVAAANRGCTALDAPVSGGDVGARNATLTIMVGGNADAFSAVEPLLRVMGSERDPPRRPRCGAAHEARRTRWRSRARCSRPSSRSPTRGLPASIPRRVLDSIGAGSAASWSLAEPRSPHPGRRLRARLLREALRQGHAPRARIRRGAGHRAARPQGREAPVRPARCRGGQRISAPRRSGCCTRPRRASRGRTEGIRVTPPCRLVASIACRRARDSSVARSPGMHSVVATRTTSGVSGSSTRARSSRALDCAPSGSRIGQRWLAVGALGLLGGLLTGTKYGARGGFLGRGAGTDRRVPATASTISSSRAVKRRTRGPSRRPTRP